MSSRHVFCEAADLAFLIIHQPADTVLWCMAINKWTVLVWHDAMFAETSLFCWLQPSKPAHVLSLEGIQC